MEIRLDLAKYGRGTQTLERALRDIVALRESPRAPRIEFGNVSRAEEFLDAPRRFWYDYQKGGRGVVRRDRRPVPSLVIGTAMHKAAEVLLLGGNPLDALEEAWESAAAGFGISGDVPVFIYEEWEAFRSYAGDLIEAAAPRLALIDEALAVEEMVWALVPLAEWDIYGNGENGCWVCLIGRPDAVVIRDEAAYHLQSKTRGKDRDLDTYTTKLGFGGHETSYGWILSQLLSDGHFGEEESQLPYVGSEVALWLKKAKPAEEPEPAPKGLSDLAEKGKIVVGPGSLARLDTCTDKQWAKAQELFANWGAREEKRIAARAAYADTAFQFLPVDLDVDKMEVGFRRMIQAIYDAAEWTRRETPISACNPNACERWNRPCAFLESKTCGGWDPVDPDDPDGIWTHRDPDYVDEARSFYLSLIEQEASFD